MNNNNNIATVTTSANHEINISGVLDFDTITLLLKQTCAEIDSQTTGNIIINFSKITRINSAGLAFLLALLRHAKATQKNIRLMHLPGKLMAAAKISDVEQLLPC